MNQKPDSESIASSGTPLTRGAVVFEKFEIVRKMGRGGMGVVLEVRDINLDKRMALKVLNSRVKDSDSLRRFQNEARNASRLSHYAVAQIYDFGVSNLGEPFMAIELVPGQTLDKVVCENGCLNLEEFFTVFGDILSGLEAAHGASIIHRDLKPGNIMVFADESKRTRAKLLDFGISKRIDMSEEELGKLTVTGQVIGTPLYISPEQASGAPVTVLSDLYSLGCVMYFSLYGRPPFLGETIFDTILLHREAEPEVLKVNALGDAMSESLVELIGRLLSKRPQERPQSAREVKSELERASAISDDADLNDDSKGDQVGIAGARLTFGAAEKDNKHGTVKKGSSAALLATLTSVLGLSLFGGYLCFILLSNTSQSKWVSNVPQPTTAGDSATVTSGVPESADGQDWIRNFRRVGLTKLKPNMHVVIKDSHLKHLSGYERIETVVLAGCPVTSSGLMSLVASKDSVSKMNLSNTNVKSLAFVEKFPNLRIIDLSSCSKLEDSDLDELKTTGHIEHLNLSNTGVTDKGIKRIAKKPFLADGSIVISILPGQTNLSSIGTLRNEAIPYVYPEISLRGIELKSVIQLLKDASVSRKLQLFGKRVDEGKAADIYMQTYKFLEGRTDPKSALEYFEVLKTVASLSGKKGVLLHRDCLYGIALSKVIMNPMADIRALLLDANDLSNKAAQGDKSQMHKPVVWNLYCLEIKSGHYKTAFLLDAEVKRLFQTTSEEFGELSEVRYRLAVYLKSNGMFREVLPIFKELAAASSQLKKRVLLGESLAGVAECQKAMSNYDDALEDYLKAIDKLKSEEAALSNSGGAGEHARRVLANCYYNAAELQCKKGRLQEAIGTNKEGRKFEGTHHDELNSKLLKQQDDHLKRLRSTTPK